MAIAASVVQGKLSMSRELALLLLGAIAVSGCGTTVPREPSWSYSGPPNSPPVNLIRNELALKPGETQEAWNQRFEATLDAAKDACARETGESKTPGFWLGYGSVFMHCMRSKGWRTVSNPA